jgi:hypothetical protein
MTLSVQARRGGESAVLLLDGGQAFASIAVFSATVYCWLYLIVDEHARQSGRQSVPAEWFLLGQWSSAGSASREVFYCGKDVQVP